MRSPKLDEGDRDATSRRLHAAGALLHQRRHQRSQDDKDAWSSSYGCSRRKSELDLRLGWDKGCFGVEFGFEFEFEFGVELWLWRAP